MASSKDSTDKMNSNVHGVSMKIGIIILVVAILGGSVSGVSAQEKEDTGSSIGHLPGIAVIAGVISIGPMVKNMKNFKHDKPSDDQGWSGISWSGVSLGLGLGLVFSGNSNTERRIGTAITTLAISGIYFAAWNIINDDPPDNQASQPLLSVSITRGF
jgi:hypothetical protein